MQAKRFYSANLEGAVHEAQGHQGPDAVVLSTDLVSDPGWRGWIGHRMVEVAATAQRRWSAARPAASTRRQRTDVASARAGVVARLLAAGLDGLLANRVAGGLSFSECRARADAAITRELTMALKEMVAIDRRPAPVEVFIGPPGVGKTTTIAKIAAGRRAAGHRPPTLVAADGFRAGAVEHLRAYASIIGAPFRAARGADELDRALASCHGGALVDTAGRSPSDGPFRAQWRVIAARSGVRTHLVMAAGTSVAMARRVLASYAAAAPARVVITKIDEAETVAPLLNVLREQRLVISYLACGQRVPEDLAVATAAGLVQAMLGASTEAPCQ